MRRLVLIVGLALALGGALAAVSAADAPVRRPVRIDSVWITPGRRTLHVQLARSACTRNLHFSLLHQGRHTVRLAFDDEVIDPGAPCIALAKLECWSVVLKRPLGGRRLMDAGSGRIIRGAPKGLPAPSPCPRAVLATP
jgi:hypothetical protein